MTKQQRERAIQLNNAFRAICGHLTEGRYIQAYLLARKWYEQLEGELNT